MAMLHAHALAAFGAVEHAFAGARPTAYNDLAHFVLDANRSALSHVAVREFLAGEESVDALLEGLVHVAHHEGTRLLETVATGARPGNRALFRGNLLICGKVATKIGLGTDEDTGSVGRAVLLYLFYPVARGTFEGFSAGHVKAYHEHISVCKGQLPVHSVFFLTTQVPNVHVDNRAVELRLHIIILSDGGRILIRETLSPHDLHEAGLTDGTITDDNNFYLNFFHYN